MTLPKNQIVAIKYLMYLKPISGYAQIKIMPIILENELTKTRWPHVKVLLMFSLMVCSFPPKMTTSYAPMNIRIIEKKDKASDKSDKSKT